MISFHTILTWMFIVTLYLALSARPACSPYADLASEGGTGLDWNFRKGIAISPYLTFLCEWIILFASSGVREVRESFFGGT